jgi:amino acid permease
MSVTDNRHGEEAEQTLGQYGYQQEFRRELKRFASFAVGFSFISITTGIFSTYGSVLNWGGPLGIWTWPFVVVGQLFVSLVFAALASRMPLAGYSYQWVSRLVNPKVGWLQAGLLPGWRHPRRNARPPIRCYCGAAHLAVPA